MSNDENIPLLPVEALTAIRKEKRTYKALTSLCERVCRQIALENPGDLLLWVYLTGLSHGAQIEHRDKENATTTRL